MKTRIVPFSRLRTGLWFWGSLSLALSFVTLAYFPSFPPADWCVDQVIDTRTKATVALPLNAFAENASENAVLELAHRFSINTGHTPRPALYLEKAAPFYGLRLNSRDLAPGIDLARRDRRDLAPQLHALPIDALVAGENVLTLRLPVSAELGNTRIDMICIGDFATLRDVHRANWWRQIGIPYLCLALFAVLTLITLALRRLNSGAPFYLWYIACLLLMPWRSIYMVLGTMPGGPALWRALSDFSILLLLYAMVRLMHSFWDIAPKRWVLVWLVLASLFQLSAAAIGWSAQYAGLKIVFWLSTVAVLTVSFLQVRLRIRHVPAVERLTMQWAMLFTVVCSALEVLTFRMDMNLRLTGLYSLATAVLALMFGFLLMRRALLGTNLLSRATDMLSHDLDRALSHAPEQGKSIWNALSSTIAGSERRQVLHDIEDGFGARMQEVLTRIRREYPQSRLILDIHRALLDLRLMIDAMDDSFTSVGGALATLRQRMRGPLANAGVHSAWDFARIGDLQVNNRRKLMELFRCLEELLSNVVQHAQATQVFIRGWCEDALIVLQVEDNGCGLPSIRSHGCGLENVKTRMQMLRGEVTFCGSEAGCGTRVELRLPRI